MKVKSSNHGRISIRAVLNRRVLMSDSNMFRSEKSWVCLSPRGRRQLWKKLCRPGFADQNKTLFQLLVGIVFSYKSCLIRKTVSDMSRHMVCLRVVDIAYCQNCSSHAHLKMLGGLTYCRFSTKPTISKRNSCCEKDMFVFQSAMYPQCSIKQAIHWWLCSVKQTHILHPRAAEQHFHEAIIPYQRTLIHRYCSQSHDMTPPTVTKTMAKQDSHEHFWIRHHVYTITYKVLNGFS